MTSKKLLQPLDRLAIAVILGLCLLIAIVLLIGNQSAPRVRSFSWQDQYVSASDTAFILNFSRPMDHESVEANLIIEPSIPGKFSWAGRRMAYTLLRPIPYGTEYQLQLEGAQDQFAADNAQGTPIKPFSATFRSRDRVFAYIGTEGEERGRLVLYNLTQQQQTLLTPADLVVTDFKPYPNSEQILFAASDHKSQAQGLIDQQLYTVTTGIAYDSPEQPEASSPLPSGRIDLVLDSKDYQNLKFDLSGDGQTIVVQRVNRADPADFGLWVIQPDSEPRRLDDQPGGDFLITPDSAAVAVAQGQGIGIVSLTEEAQENLPEQPLDFLPKFGQVLSFTRDGSTAAMVKFNVNPENPTRSLFVVNNQGQEQELLRTSGSILNCEFAPSKEVLYCLLTQLIAGEYYQEDPFLAAIDLEDKQANALLKWKVDLGLSNQRDVQMSLSPDGLALLFDQVVTTIPSEADMLRTDDAQAIVTGRLWLLPIAESTSPNTLTQLQAEPLFAGFNPRWLP